MYDHFLLFQITIKKKKQLTKKEIKHVIYIFILLTVDDRES